MSNPDDPAATPRQRSGTWLRQTGEESALLAPDGQELHVLNETALALWELCDGRTEVTEMVEAICELFAADRDVVQHDVTSTLARFSDAGLLVWS